MTESDQRGGSGQAKLPSLGSSLSRPFDSSSLRRQPLSPPLLPSSSSGPLPPPPPTRLHSYHHPIAASYTSSSSYNERNRQAAPSLWKEPRPPPLEHRVSEGAGASSSFSRLLPPLTSSNSNSNAFQLPSLSASLPSSTSWHGRELAYQPGQHTQAAHIASSHASRDAYSNEQRSVGQDPKLLSLSGQLRDLNRPLLVDSSPSGLTSPGADERSQASRKQAKAHVPSACLNCKRAHLACDVGRPCRRCINLGKSDTCIDVQHKKRGRPRLKDRPSSQAGVPTLQTLEGKSDNSGSPASGPYTRQSPGSEQGYFRSPTRTNDMVSPPLLSSSAVMQVSGRTHGPGAHPRSASNSVSASSYPYSRPDHLRHPMEVSSSHGAGHPIAPWSYQSQHPTHVPDRTHPMTGRHHSHSLSYEQPQHPHHHQPQQPQQHGLYAHPASHPSSNVQTADAAAETSDGIVSAVVTMICSTNLQCARSSEECIALLGYKPSELNERSLFELVHPSETSRLQEIWTSLIDPVGVIPQSVPAAADVVMSTPAARLMAPAAGTIFVQENMRLRQRNGMYDFYSVRLHLGGGFGVDLYRRETLDRAYIVASLLKLGNDAVHPDPSILRAPYSHDSSPSQGFRTPAGPQAHGRAMQSAGQHQRHPSDSLHQRPSHLESNTRRDDEPPQSTSVPNGLSRQDSSRGVKRSSAEMDLDEPAASSHPASSRTASHTNGAAANASTSYPASKTAACSPPPVVRSLLTDRTRGNTGRDGILC
ncbi:PAS domain protein [Kalmanozyma brasiliensis GHG001]|uniref:PAS domain protein n=1 Tax=Kalmanozyma brasiliensis (strain GHG001) TaxID=1365824 RepID=UPI002867C4BE|nr:PAS domain protein [Kalmanozyma brasiliensis GHG001]EST07030.2 PAS domain protein [Kalmanozyma brasiliensis GHG001]